VLCALAFTPRSPPLSTLSTLSRSGAVANDSTRRTRDRIKKREAERNSQAAENIKRQTSERERERLPQGWRGRRWPGPMFRRSQCTCCRRHRKHTHPAHATPQCKCMVTPQCKCMVTHFANEHATTQLCIQNTQHAHTQHAHTQHAPRHPAPSPGTVLLFDLTAYARPCMRPCAHAPMLPAIFAFEHGTANKTPHAPRRGRRRRVRRPRT
jgi:hypothetical protein